MTQRPCHNIPTGHIEACQVCGSRRLELVLDLGHQPLCDTLLTADDLNQPEIYYPLRQMWCRDCTLSQIDFAVSGSVVYHESYPYRTGVTRELAAYQDEMAAALLSQLPIATDSLVVDVGCNDGTLLSAFRSRGMRTVGVEPTGIARFAREAGIDAIQAPFDQQVARQIVESHGPAKLVTATNVFAHMASLGDVLEGLEVLVDPAGFFVLENHYLSAVIDRLQFDTIYHEHLRTYSLRSLVRLFDYYDFKVVDAQKVSRYGGNIRVVVAKGKQAQASDRVRAILSEEDGMLTRAETYHNFRESSLRLRDQLRRLAIDAQERGTPLVGNSCPGRSSTLLNYCDIGRDLMPYIAEQPASLKLGKFLPGKHIPIVNNQRLLDEQPPAVVLLAWHYAEPIAQQLRARGLKSQLIVPLPEIHTL